MNAMFTIKAEAMPGSTPLEACTEAKRLANLLNASIEFKFNDILCFAMPGGNAKEMAKMIEEVNQRTSKGPRIVCT